MNKYDLLIKNGMVHTAVESFEAEIGVSEGKITAIGQNLGHAERVIDAKGMLVLPGGIDAHCHIEQESSTRIMTADDFYSGSVSAAFGGNTTFLPFAAQHRGQSLREVVDTVRERARNKAVIDYGLHLIISDPTQNVLEEELPSLIKEGYTSFKVYMTYEMLKINDREMLDILAVARKHGALTMVHAENNEVINWISERLMRRGYNAPKFHAVSHSPLAESEASRRAIDLARLVDARMLIVHVSEGETARAILQARNHGLSIYGETCPQYLFLTENDLDREGMEGAKYCCSPPPRHKANQEVIWRGISNGTFQVFSSDHAPYRFDHTGKLKAGPNPKFTEIANGLPGIELRVPLLFSEGVGKGRIDIHRFVAMTSTNVAKIYGLHPRKGTIAVGSDADIAIWDPHKEVTVTWDLLHDNVGYTPYEGQQLKGWPITVLSRGNVVGEHGDLKADQGSGQFLRRTLSDAANPLGRLEPEMDPSRNFGAELMP